jgi:diguanylate cyclase (GGDEF)-like protein
MIDLDRMKAINDSLGHQAGDRYLRSVGRAIGDGSRRSDFAARFGGDEFVVILPETDRAGAATIAGVLQRRVSSVQIAAGSHVLSASASIGTATYPEDGTTQAQLLAHADLQMYAEKLGRRTALTVAADAGG